MSIKIAVTGEIRSGKDTFSQVVIDNVPGTEKLYFAEGIKEVIGICFPEAFEGGRKPRKLYQEIGTYMRSINPDVWVNHAKRTMDFYENLYGSKNFIVTDLRQLNEFTWLKENGFTVVKVDADLEIRKARMIAAGDTFTEESLNHETEITIRELPYDYLLTNSGTEEEFKRKSLHLLETIKGVNHAANN